MLNAMRHTRGRYWLSLLLLVTLTACVTTETSVFSGKKDEDKALEARVQLALRYLNENNPKMAIVHLQSALNLDAKSPRVHEILGVAFQQSGEIELADKHYKKSLYYDSNYSRGRNNYAAFLYNQARYEEATEQLERVVEDVYYEKRAEAFANLGLGYLKLGRIDKAEKVFLRSIQMDDTQVSSKLELADLYFSKGEFASAQRYFALYKSEVRQVSPRALMLGIRIADQFDDKNAVASYSMTLKNLYPKSQEFLELKEWQKQRADASK